MSTHESTNPTERPHSPRWNNTTKMVAGLSLVAVLAGVFVKFNSLLGPLLITFILTYLLYPITDFIQKKTHLPWRAVVTVIFLLVAVMVLGLLTWGGITIVNQLQSLISFLQKTIADLPTIMNDLSNRTFILGPFSFSLKNIYFSGFSSQILGAVQSVFSRLGSLLGGFASGAAATIGWIFFVLWLSYFIVAESEGKPERLLSVRIPGYSYDVARFRLELSRIWNAFLRGQLLIFTVTVVVYFFLLGILGVRFYFGLALLAGLARFVPYVGPAVAWTVYGLVAFFQGDTIFSLSPIGYVVLVVGSAWITDVILDNLVVPRVLADSLKIHPALIMVAAIAGVSLLGLIGVVLAAPVVATLKLAIDYVFRKLLDQDPWEGMETVAQPVPISTYFERVRQRLSRIRSIVQSKKGSNHEKPN